MTTTINFHVLILSKKNLRELFVAEKQLKMELLKLSVTIPITCDHWTSTGNDSYIGLTCHIIDSDWKMKSFTLGVYNFLERHTSENILNQFENIGEEWGCYKKIFSIGTDNGRNIIKAVSTLPFKQFRCLAHTLQLIIKSAMDETGFDAILAKCHKIVGHFKHSPANNIELKKEQIAQDLPEESLIQHVATRWNSMHDMLNRLIKHRLAIDETLKA